jgi:hypothetical protein
MSKIASRLLALIVVTTAGVLACPAQAEPRHRHTQADGLVIPAQAGYVADPWQKTTPEFIQPAPPDAVQKVPLGVLQKGPLEPVQALPMPALQKGEIPCCPSPGCGCPQQRRIEYRNHCRLRKGTYACAPPVQTVLFVPGGQCGQCAVEVPVCIPACCTDAPQMEARRGLLGRTRVLYRWCCGFEVEVVFTHDGDLIVHYDGL